jgi:hypothetical protein
MYRREYEKQKVNNVITNEWYDYWQERTRIKTTSLSTLHSVNNLQHTYVTVGSFVCIALSFNRFVPGKLKAW